MKIKGTVVYVDLNGGFWGIETTKGDQYLPINMPEQIKTEGAKVTLEVNEVDLMNMYMWGRTVEVISFHTLG